MRGRIDGHRVSVSGYRNQPPEIEVHYSSGLSSVDISPRAGRTSNRSELSILDPEFAMQFVVYTSVEGEGEAEIRSWLTLERRQAIATLGELVDLDDIEEDEIEVRLRSSEWIAPELVRAVQLCVDTAKRLDESFVDDTPQDQIRFDDTPRDDAVRLTKDVQDDIGPPSESD